MKDVLVIGGVFREIFESPGSRRTRYGGSGLVAAVTAARLNAATALSGFVGEEDADVVRIELAKCGASDSHLLTVPGASGTFLYPPVLNPLTPWPMYRPAESVPDRKPDIPDAKFVLIFGFPDFDPIDRGWLTGISQDSVLIWDRQGWLSRARNSANVVPLQFRKKVYLANVAEFEDESGTSEQEFGPAKGPPTGFDVAVIKDGAAGVTVIGSNEIEFIPAFTVDTSNTVGSGDVFAGAFAARLAAGDNNSTAAQWGCAAASVAISTGVNLLTSKHIAMIRRLMQTTHGI